VFIETDLLVTLQPCISSCAEKKASGFITRVSLGTRLVQAGELGESRSLEEECARTLHLFLLNAFVYVQCELLELFFFQLFSLFYKR
jgi:hypothetical protein